MWRGYCFYFSRFTIMCLGMVFSIYHVWGLQRFLNQWLDIFYQFYKICQLFLLILVLVYIVSFLVTGTLITQLIYIFMSPISSLCLFYNFQPYFLCILVFLIDISFSSLILLSLFNYLLTHILLS